jgi:hypothetical protein
MLEADTVKTHAKNVRPKSEDVSERARRVVRRNECGRRETILCVDYWSVHGNTEVSLINGPFTLGDVIRTTTSIACPFFSPWCFSPWWNRRGQ